MKRVREIDLEAPVPEDDDGEDDGDGEETVTSPWNERAFTKKGRWIHEIPQQGPKAEKQPRDPASPNGIDNDKYENANFQDYKGQHRASEEIERHEQTSLTSKLRTVAPVDLPMDSDVRESGPQVDHEMDTFETPNIIPELGRQPVAKDIQMTEASEEGVEKIVRKELPVQLKEERTFSSPPAVLLYSIGNRQDVELHSVLEKQGVLLSQPDLGVRLEGICIIGQNVGLIKESNTRKVVTEMIQQQLWTEKEPSVIEALVKVLCSIATISCADDLSEDKNLDWASYVARLLLQYITTKDGGSCPLKSGSKLQLLRSLYLVGKGGAILELESVGPLAKEQLASSNPRLREYGIRVLVQSIKERKAGDGRDWEETNVGRSGDVQRSIAEGETLMHTLLEYTRDPYPNVREAVVCCVLSLHNKGFALKHSTYKVAVALLRDKFESVRISAVKLMGVWAKATAGDVLEGPESKYIDKAFLQICNMMTDMTMSVRQESCNVLAEMTGVSDSVMLQSLTKKVLTTSATEKGSTGEGSSSMSNGDSHVAKLEENKLLEWAAGAFVVGLEDEFWEVRSAAVMALAKLGLSSEKVAHGALELIVDMINDDSILVRQKTIKALANLGLAGRLSVLETHLHMFIGILEDSSAVMRKGVHELLSAISLPSITTFQLTVRAIFTSLDKHPEDEKSLLLTLDKLGRSHASHTESLAHELVQELRGLLNEVSGLDEPRSVGILVLLLGAATANGKIISLIPSDIISIASLVSNKLPINLPSLEVAPLGFKTVLYVWSATDGFLARNHGGDQSRDSYRMWRPADDSKHLLGHVNLESWGQENGWEGKMEKDRSNHERQSTVVLDSEGDQGTAWPSGMAKQYQLSRLFKSGEHEILKSTKRIVGSALGTRLLLDMKAFKVVLQRLSGCRKELKSLKGRCLGLSGMVSFYDLYLECLVMVVQLRANFVSQESRALVKKSGFPQDALNRLDSILKHILHRFSGFSFEHLLHILELHAIVYVWKLAVQPVDHTVNDGPSSMPLLELRLTVRTAEKITKNHCLPPSLLLKSVLEQLLNDEGKTNILNFMRTSRQLALSYWPCQITINPSLKEMWASMNAPGSDFDHPVGFSAGLPLGIPIDITLYNVPDMYSLWIQFSQDTSAVGYKRLDVENSGRSFASNIHQLSTLLQLDEMPSVASSVCRICIVIEGDNYQRTLETVDIGKGPQGCIVPICTEMKVHLIRIRERGSKQLPRGKR